MHEHPAMPSQQTHPLRWIAAAIVVAVLGWDIWQTVHEARAAGQLPPAARVRDDAASAPGATPGGHRLSAPE